MPDQRIFRTAGETDADGGLTLTFRGRDSAAVRVRQVTNEMADGAGATCCVRLDGALVCPLEPVMDAAVEPPAIWVEAGVPLTVEWTGVPAGAGVPGAMVVIYDYGET